MSSSVTVRTYVSSAAIYLGRKAHRTMARFSLSCMQVAVATRVFLKLYVSKEAGAAIRVGVKTEEPDDGEGRRFQPRHYRLTFPK